MGSFRNEGSECEGRLRHMKDDYGLWAANNKSENKGKGEKKKKMEGEEGRE